jgi:HEAT repeat protein
MVKDAVKTPAPGAALRQRGRRRSEARALLAGLVIAGLGAACAAPMSVKAAARGDQVGLKVALSQEKAQGKLGRAQVREVAKAVAEREIRGASGPDAMVRIEEARGCSSPLAGALEDRAERQDEPAAGATLALMDARVNRTGDGETLLRKHGASPSAPWRAVAARGAVGTKLGAARRKFFLDPDERVRLSALRAALELADPADASALLEAARLDPSPLAQAIAARALGGLESPEVVVALRDRYATADEGLRQSIVDGWGRAPLAKAGGRRELIIVAENQTGAYAVEAGALLLQMSGDAEARAIGQRALVRAIGQGLARDRRLAIGRAPIAEREVLEATKKAARDPDLSVRIAALSRLGDVAEERTKALSDLRKLAEGGARDALLALARAGDPAALEGVAKDLTSPDVETRLAAMNVLVTAGRFASAADLLADANPGVRMRASCAVLAANPP